ncbi:MAG: hypothetical protein JNK85_04955 [Verrucomicrobiales bacterium]|nr:hypothetical protein [Verrucomicrobiales bacterium]
MPHTRTFQRVLAILAGTFLFITGPIAAGQAALPTVDIDVLVLYTAAARDGGGGSESMKRTILAAFEEANQIHSNSLTGVRLQPVAVMETDLVESGSIRTDVQTLDSKVGPLRRDFRADLVVLICENDSQGIPGLAGPGVPGQMGDRNAALAVILRSRTSGLGMAIANRTGWLLGCGVDRPEDGSDQGQGSYSYSRGHRFTVQGVEYVTVMSLATGMRIPHFSNPNVRFRGRATGVPIGEAGEADNASTIRRVAPLVAQYEKCTNRVQFELAATVVREDAGVLRLRLVRAGPLETIARLRVAFTNGTARAGTDFLFTNQFVEFAAGDAEKSVEVPLIQNRVAQAPREFGIFLDNADLGTGIGDIRATRVTLEDEDGTFQFAGTSAVLDEGTPGTTIRILRSRGIDSAGVVTLEALDPGSPRALRATLIGTGSSDGAAELPLTLAFAPGETEKSVRVEAPENAEQEPDQSLTLQLTDIGLEGTESPAVLKLWVRDNDRSGHWLNGFPTRLAGGIMDGPVLALPDGAFLACVRPQPRAAVFLVRVLADGTQDPQWPTVRFQDTTEPDETLRFGRISALERQEDGKLIAAGYFATVNGEVWNNLVRLLPDGRVDETFKTGIGFGGAVWSVCLQADQKIVVVGEFVRVNGVRRRYAARLHADGSLDSSFAPEFGADGGAVWLTTVAMQGEKILVGGNFEQIGDRQANNLVRLKPDGKFDTGFFPLFTGIVTGLRVLPGGSFYAFGPFQAPRRWAGLFRANGSADPQHRFQGLNGAVHDILPLADGEALLSGHFAGATNTQPMLAKFRADGSADETFGPRFETPGRVEAMLPGPFGQLTLVGSMKTVGDQEPRNLARIESPGWSTELAVAHVDGAGVAIEGQTIRGLAHRLERSADLKQWEVVDQRESATTSTTFRDPTPTPVSIYRLRAGGAAASEP